MSHLRNIAPLAVVFGLLMPLFPSRTRISAVAASSKFLVWLTDAGPDRLSLKMIRLELDDKG